MLHRLLQNHLSNYLRGISTSFLSFAQEMTTADALRYAVDNLNGTARFRGISGAFGAVGGDLSALNVNPAGSLFFKNNLLEAL